MYNINIHVLLNASRHNTKTLMKKLDQFRQLDIHHICKPHIEQLVAAMTLLAYL